MKNSTFEKHAEALFSLAEDEKKVKEYEAALQKVLADFAREPLLKSCLSSYALDKAEAYQILDDLYGKIPLKSLTPFLKVVVNHHLMDHLSDIEECYRVLSNESLGIKEGLVYSATPLTPEQLALVKATFEKKLGCEVSLTARSEPSLLGGIKVSIDGKVYDGTLEAKLEALRLRLLAQGGKV
jgi:F-type H+-transporting ATPase subunit delta